MITQIILFTCCLFILLGSLIITIKTRFVQVRLLKEVFKTLKNSISQPSSSHRETIAPHRALFTAMSTTLGISTIVGPIIAVHLGGPGALVGFLLTAFFGSAATFVEVQLSIQHRKILPSGTIMGGPMRYLEALISPAAAKWYAVCCLILMTAWSGIQANQLASILDSPLLGAYRIPAAASGAALAVLIFAILFGGIKWIGSLSSKLVPLMFILYIGASLWILFCNLDQWGPIFREIGRSFFSPYSMATGALVGGIAETLRWGIFKGTQACEAGIGTQAIPHSMAETQDPKMQATLAMLSTWTAGLLAFLSGFVALVTQTWQNPELPLGISMVAASFQLYFSSFGFLLVALSALLFGFGTILGNSYNASQCFAYLTDNKKRIFYLVATALMIFIGAIAEVKTFWSSIDLVLAAMAVPHMTALLMHALKQPKTEVV